MASRRSRTRRDKRAEAAEVQRYEARPTVAAELLSKPQDLVGRCQLSEHGMCCCTCRHHIRDFHHCTTVQSRPQDKCVCSQPKGWICMPPELEAAFSGWTEHGLCEMHEEQPGARRLADEAADEARTKLAQKP